MSPAPHSPSTPASTALLLMLLLMVAAPAAARGGFPRLAAAAPAGASAAPPAPATLDPALARLALAHPAERVAVWIHPIEHGVARRAALERRLVEAAAAPSRAERHRRVVEALATAAAHHQAALIAALEEQAAVARDAPLRYRAHWLADLVVVETPAGRLPRLASLTAAGRLERAPRAQPPAPPGAANPRTGGASGATTTGREGGGETGGAAGAAAPAGLPLPPGLHAIRADAVWHELGITGAGRLIGLLDTGVAGTHPALANAWRGRDAPAATAWLDLVNGTASPVDPVGHGTRVLGIACGLEPATGDTTGVAWGAQWIAAAAIGQPTGAEFDADVLAALEWLCDPDGDPATIDDVPDAVIGAFGVEPQLPGTPPYESCDLRFQQAIDHLEAAGIAVVFSAGNDGPDPATIASPAGLAVGDGRNFAVGAVDATHADFPYPVAEFSSRGPSPCDGVSLKPDLVAPGVSVRTTFPGPTVGNFSGTSAAVPHVGGVIALLREVDPDLPVAVIREILLAATVDLEEAGPDMASGHGLLDARLAVDLAIARSIAVAPAPPAAGRLRLGPPRPNPTAGAVEIEFEVGGNSAREPLVLEVFSVAGRRVARLGIGRPGAGTHRLRWNGRDARGRRLPAGVYFIRAAGAGAPGCRLVLLP